MKNITISTKIYLIFFLLIAKINLAQNSSFLWKVSTNNGQSESITQDNSSNTYVTTDEQAGMAKVLKIKPNGQTQFINSYLPAGYTSISHHDIKYINGHIFLAAVVSNSNTNQYYRGFVAKIDTMGNLIDQLIIDTLEVSLMMGIKSAPYYSFGFYSDNQNNFYRAYTRAASPSSPQPIYTIRKFNQNLNLISLYQDTVPYIQPAGPYVVKPDGTVYYSFAGAVMKINSNLSAQVWNCSFSTNEYVSMMGLDNNNNIYVLTKEYGMTSNYITRLIKIEDLGNTYNLVYNQIIDDSNVEYTILLVDPVNNALYTSGFYYSIPPYQRKVKKHNASDASILWSDSAYSNASISDLLLSAQNNLIAIGGGTDYNVWFYNNSGGVVSTLVYNGPCGANDGIKVGLVDSNNKLIVTGASCESANTVAYSTTIKYNIPNIITTDLIENNNHTGIKLHPNPANDIVCINCKNPVKQVVAIDSKGAQKTLSLLGNNCIDVTDLNNGVYMLKLQFMESVLTEKIVINR